MTWITTLGLFVVTALAEIVGCYLVLIWVKRDGPLLALAGSVCSLMLFAWLLTRHPAESGRVYAAYGGVYTCTALAWLWLVDGVPRRARLGGGGHHRPRMRDSRGLVIPLNRLLGQFFDLGGQHAEKCRRRLRRLAWYKREG